MKEWHFVAQDIRRKTIQRADKILRTLARQAGFKLYGNKQKYKHQSEYHPVDKKRLYFPVSFHTDDITFMSSKWLEFDWRFGTFFEIGLYYPEAIIKFIVTYYMPELYATMEKTDIMDYKLIDLVKTSTISNPSIDDIDVRRYVLDNLTDINPMKSGKMDMAKLNEITSELNESIDTFNKFAAKRGNNLFTYMGVSHGAHPDLAMIKKLVAEDPEQLELRNTVGQTPIMRAIYINSPEIVKYLIDAGANLDEYSKIIDYTIRTGSNKIFNIVYNALINKFDKDMIDNEIMDIVESTYPDKVKKYTKLLDAAKITE